MESRLLLVCTLTLFLLWRSAVAVRVKGSIVADAKERTSLHYLTRFGVGSGHDFYVYGIARSQFSTMESRLALGLVPQHTWNNLFSASKAKEGLHCGKVFQGALQESKIVPSYRNACHLNDTTSNMDYIRTLPCAPSACNQPKTTEVFSGYNFTYTVEKVQKTEFYYLFFLTCDLEEVDCQWSQSKNVSIYYEIHLVNSEPNRSNYYSNEFSYELDGVLTLQLFFIVSYICLIAVHFLLHSRGLQKRKRYSIHLLIKLFSASLVLEGVYVLTEMIHLSIYAANGRGQVSIQYFGEVCNQVSDWLLILSVILVGKGWQVTTSSLRWSKVTVLIWGAYIVFSGIFFIWTVVSGCG